MVLSLLQSQTSQRSTDGHLYSLSALLELGPGPTAHPGIAVLDSRVMLPAP
jgi:hypothetical protein